jgi:hypothetical protein
MTPHHTALGNSGWQLWRDAALASAGFPASRVAAICDDELVAAADALGAASADALERYEAAYVRARRRLAAVIREIAGDPGFREAVAWQDPAQLCGHLDKARAGKLTGHRGRKETQVIAGYLQRYCLSNETLGFFGPVGWARLGEDSTCLDVRPGSGLLSRRTTYLEWRAVDALATTIAARPDILPWLIPRLAPSTAPGREGLRLPFRTLAKLSENEARVIALCDGTRTVRMLIGDEADQELLAALLRLRDLGAVEMGLEVPISAWPERDLKDRITRIADPGARRRALEPVAELVAARDAVSAAAGDAERLHRAINAATEAFGRIAGAQAMHGISSGRFGRTLVYEDTVRDMEVRIGPHLTDMLAPSLSPLLDSAAWLANTIAARYLAVFRHMAGQASAHNGAGGVPLLRLAVMAMPELFLPSDGREPATVAQVVAEFQQRWRRILAVPPGVRHHHVASDVVAQCVAREFATGPALWSSARLHSADVMIAAVGHEAVARGECQFVLGKLHVATNILESRLFVAQHPDPDRLLAAAEADHLDRRVYAIPRRNSPFVASRQYPPSALLSSRYTYLCLGSEAVVPPARARALCAPNMLVEPRGDDLVVRSGKNGQEYSFLEVIGEMLTALVAPAFRPLDAAGYQPRVSIGKMVVARESWTFAAREATWAFIKDERGRYAAARRWRAAHGLPERAFVTAQTGGTPVAVDLRSLPLVGLLADAIRRAAARGDGAFTVTEMLPDADQLWLRDADGNRYTAELKLVAVDGSSHGRRRESFPVPGRGSNGGAAPHV